VLKFALVVGSPFDFDLTGSSSNQVEVEGRADDKTGKLEHYPSDWP